MSLRPPMSRLREAVLVLVAVALLVAACTGVVWWGWGGLRHDADVRAAAVEVRDTGAESGRHRDADVLYAWTLRAPRPTGHHPGEWRLTSEEVAVFTPGAAASSLRDGDRVVGVGDLSDSDGFRVDAVVDGTAIVYADGFARHSARRAWLTTGPVALLLLLLGALAWRALAAYRRVGRD